MFRDQVEAAIVAARGGRALDEVSRLVWRALAAGELGDDDAQALAERIHARRELSGLGRAETGQGRPPARIGMFGPPRPAQRPRVRSEAVERRRRVAASGALPPAIAARFTTGEAAVLSIIVLEVRERGRCTLPMDAIAARAGVSRTLAKGALRIARSLGLVRVTHRPRPGQKHLPNLIEITDRAWCAWIAARPQTDRGQKPAHHGYRSLREKRRQAAVQDFGDSEVQALASAHIGLHKCSASVPTAARGHDGRSRSTRSAHAR